MRADYRKVFSSDMRATTELEQAINGWNRLAVGLRSDVMSLDGLDVPTPAAAGQ